MNLKELRELGAFVSDAPVEKEVTWQHGGEEYTFTVHVKRISFGDLESILVLSDTDNRSRTALMLSKTILLNGGGEALSYEDAYQLDPQFAKVLAQAIQEVNGSELDPDPKA